MSDATDGAGGGVGLRAGGDDERPCAGLTVVEVVAGTSELGLGAAAGVPGMLLAALGADVVRVTGAGGPLAIDEGLSWSRVWHRDKRLVATDDATAVRALLSTADVALVHGPEALVEGRGLGFRDLRRANPALAYVRCRPSRTDAGETPDYALLVEAAAGFCTQLDGHRPGPIHVDVHASEVGAASVILVSALALLYRRAVTGAGGWAETSLYEGMLATLGCMIGRSERAAPEIESYWEKGSTFPSLLYRCADGELVQIWFGGKGMYPALLEVLGDEPSAEGYYSDQMTGRLGERAKGWGALFATRPRDEWVGRLVAAGVACEPVLGPGEVLAEPHLAGIGLAVERTEHGHRDVVAGSPIAVHPAPGPATPGEPGGAVVPGDPAAAAWPGRGGLLAGLRVVDFSAFVAGPLAAEVLADLGADVVKVEPPEGEAMRAAAYAVAACQRGKRSLALNIGAPDARDAVERLLAGADVVLHNFRVGVAERLGIDAATLARLNPGAVHCHASAFGVTGPRAMFPANDALMQAVTGFARAVGGAGNDPITATWIPIDMSGGWVAAAGVLAGLVGRARRGRGQVVVTSLIGAGVLMNSGVYLRDGELVRGPELDAAQTGYGPGYRLYRGSDGAWLALVLPDRESWRRLAELPEARGLPGRYAPLRTTDREVAEAAEGVLEAAFATAPAAAWVRRLQGIGLPARLVGQPDRDAFRTAVLDDPVNRRLGRAVSYETADWGHFEQIGPLVRCGPDTGDGPRLMLPGVGEHTVEVLTELGLTAPEIDTLLSTKVAAAP